MSQENVQTIARLYDEFLARPERLASPEQLAFYDPAVEIHQSESLLGTQGTFQGYEGLGRAAREVFAVFREGHYVPERLVDAGDQVVATVEFRGIGKESGVKVSEPSPICGRSKTAGSSPDTSTLTRPKPSQPWGCRSSNPSGRATAATK